MSILSCPLTVVSLALNCALHPACFKLESKAKLCCAGNLNQHHQDGLCHSVWMSKIAKTWLSAGSTFSSWNVHVRGSSKCQTGTVNVLTTLPLCDPILQISKSLSYLNFTNIPYLQFQVLLFPLNQVIDPLCMDGLRMSLTTNNTNFTCVS